MTLTAGQRVEVPFGRMRKEGVVLSLTQETDVPPEKLRDILRPLEDYAAICPTLLTLAQQMADDVHCPLAETLRLMLPAQMRGGRIQVKTQTVAQAAKPREMLEAAALAEKRSPKRRLLLTVLSDERTHPVEELKLLVREPLQALRQIEAAGLIALREEEVLRRPGGNTPDTTVPDPPLTPGQEEALSVMLPDLRSGKRQNRGVHPPRAPDARAGEIRHDSRAGNRSHAANGHVVSGAVRGGCGGAALAAQCGRAL